MSRISRHHALSLGAVRMASDARPNTSPRADRSARGPTTYQPQHKEFELTHGYSTLSKRGFCPGNMQRFLRHDI